MTDTLRYDDCKNKYQKQISGLFCILKTSASTQCESLLHSPVKKVHITKSMFRKPYNLYWVSSQQFLAFKFVHKLYRGIIYHYMNVDFSMLSSYDKLKNIFLLFLYKFLTCKMTVLINLRHAKLSIKTIWINVNFKFFRICHFSSKMVHIYYEASQMYGLQELEKDCFNWLLSNFLANKQDQNFLKNIRLVSFTLEIYYSINNSFIITQANYIH